MLVPTQPPGSDYRLIYEGAVQVAGNGVEQRLDLSALAPYILDTKYFQDSWRIFIQPLDDGVSAVEGEVEFSPDNKEMIFTVDSSGEESQIRIEAWFLTSTIR